LPSFARWYPLFGGIYPNKPLHDHPNGKFVSLRRWRTTSGVGAMMLVIGALTALPGARAAMLGAAGRVLVVNDPIEPADIIVVTVDAGAAGLLEAADLVHGGTATRAALFRAMPNAAEREFQRRLPAFEDAEQLAVRQLRSLGVDAIEYIPASVSGTTDEASAFAEWCRRQGFHSVVVVSTSDHSRRVRRVLRRSMKGQSTKVIVRSARFSLFDADRWWQSRAGARTEVVELEKLLLEFVRHPFP
jgi:uncharacterized SAM-binding protein YcdF (DUF218 family)